MLVLKTVRAKPMVTHTEMIVHLYISELNKISTVCEKLFNSSIRKQNPVKFDFAILQALVKTRNKGKNKCTVKQFFFFRAIQEGCMYFIREERNQYKIKENRSCKDGKPRDDDQDKRK
jgi:hypothetical protein